MRLKRRESTTTTRHENIKGAESGVGSKIYLCGHRKVDGAWIKKREREFGP